MPTELIANLANSTIANVGGISSGATSLTVAAGTASRFPAAVTGVSQFRCVLIAAADVAAPLGKPVEFITVTNVATDTFTITRASESSGAHPAAAWPQGTVIANVETAGAITNLLSGYLPLAGGNLTGDLAMGGHDVTGAGTVAATTLTGDGSGITNLPTPPAPTLDAVLTAGASTSQVPTFSGGIEVANGDNGAVAFGPGVWLSNDGSNGIIVNLPDSINNPQFLHDGSFALNGNQLLGGSGAVFGDNGGGWTLSGTNVSFAGGTTIDNVGNINLGGNAIQGGSGAVLHDSGFGWQIGGPLLMAGGAISLNDGGGSGGSAFNLDGGTINGGSGATLQNVSGNDWTVNGGIQSNPLNVSWPYGTARVAISSPSYAIAGEFPLLLAAPTDQYGNAPLMILMNTTGGDPGWAFQIQDSNDPINPNAFAFDHAGTASQYTFGVDAFKLGGFGIYLNDGLGSGGTNFKLDSGTISDAGVTCYSAGTFYGAFSGDGTDLTGVTAAAPSGAQNLVYASPDGSSGDATLRALVLADLPSGTSTTSTNSGTVANGATLTVTHASDPEPRKRIVAAYAPGSGADLTTGGTAIGTCTYSGSGAIGNSGAFDKNPATAAADPSGYTVNSAIGYDFGSGQSHAIIYATVQLFSGIMPTGPQTLKLQYSDDNSSWTDVSGGTLALNIGITTVQSFGPFSASGSHRYWRLHYSSGTSGGGTNFAVAEVTFSETGVDASLPIGVASGITVSFTDTTTVFTNNTGGTLTLTGVVQTTSTGSFPIPTLDQVLGAGNISTHNAVVNGVSDNSLAAAGVVGEEISSTLAVGSAVSLTSGTAKTITSINLTAGDWLVDGMLDFRLGTLTTSSYQQGGSSTTTDALDSQDTYNSVAIAVPAGLGVDPSVQVPLRRLHFNTTTTVYLIAKAGFATSTMTAYGTIHASRVR